MSTDGVKIIDGDTAHDVYNGILDMYDAGATIEQIREKNPFPPDSFDDFDNEVHITAYALAFWEMGEMDELILSEVKRVIEKGACVKEWSVDRPEDGIARQKELDKFWKKISSVNTKVRKRKKYKQVSKFIFNVNDVVVFRQVDGTYRLSIVLAINQYRGECKYYFSKTLYRGEGMPNLADIPDIEVCYTKIGNLIEVPDVDAILKSLRFQEGSGEMLKYKSILDGYSSDTSFTIAIDSIFVAHRDLVKFSDKFECIGTLVFKDEYRKMSGTTGFADDYASFCQVTDMSFSEKIRIGDLMS